MTKQKEWEDIHPHSPDVEERDIVDDGFSSGWGFHMQPSVRYWIDCHTHMRESEAPIILAATKQWHDSMWSSRLRRHVAVDGTVENFDGFAAAGKADDRFLWLCRLPWNSPDVKHLERCHEAGALGLKLHNSTLMEGDFPIDFVTSPEWQPVYAAAGRLHMPILWHVTQRRTAAPYTGGGEDSYWKVGRERGVTFGNKDLMDRFLQVVQDYPETNFIGAHQLHVGPDRLAELFAKHDNLFIDTSIGCFVAEDDLMHASDAQRWREFVIAFQDRILFGSDVVMTERSVSTDLLRKHFLGHVRWVKQLHLPQSVLSKVAHENFERLTGLAPANLLPWGALRP